LISAMVGPTSDCGFRSALPFSPAVRFLRWWVQSPRLHGGGFDLPVCICPSISIVEPELHGGWFDHHTGTSTRGGAHRRQSARPGRMCPGRMRAFSMLVGRLTPHGGPAPVPVVATALVQRLPARSSSVAAYAYPCARPIARPAFDAPWRSCADARRSCRARPAAYTCVSFDLVADARHHAPWPVEDVVLPRRLGPAHAAIVASPLPFVFLWRCAHVHGLRPGVRSRQRHTSRRPGADQLVGARRVESPVIDVDLTVALTACCRLSLSTLNLCPVVSWPRPCAVSVTAGRSHRV